MMITDLEQKIGRLARLAEADEGFYILALHSFIEDYLRHDRGYGEGPPFPELARAFREELLERCGHGPLAGLECLGGLGRQQALAHRVRRSFERPDPQEAAAATHLFLTFCRLAGIEAGGGMQRLEKALERWSRRAPDAEEASVMRHMQAELRRMRGHGADLLRQRDELARLRQELADVQRRLTRLDGGSGAARRERNALIAERDRLLAATGRYAELDRYLDYLGRLSAVTRTRADYEQALGQLTPEQEEAVAGISLKGDCLIRGGSGTGKSLVLVEALRRAVRQEELDFGERESVMLLTPTRTLAKYSRYLAELRGLDLPLGAISTPDTLFQGLLKAIDPGLRFDAGLPSRFLEEAALPDFLNPPELEHEIEGFLFGGAVTEGEYLEEMISRAGFRRRLSRRQRREVWRLRDEMARAMEERRIYSPAYARYRLLQYLRDHPQERPIRPIRLLFLDEAQDFTPAALMALRELTRGAMVMAGDTDQSHWPFVRAGLDLRGTVRVLKTNFRGTRQVQALAEAFRSSSRSTAFREGPIPELYLADGAAELERLLVQKLSLFIGELGYEPENVCLLVQREAEVRSLLELLGGNGIEALDVESSGFAFRERERVRVATLASSKGLDFPVVLLYLPELERPRQLDPGQAERQLRELVHVGLTRAMDHVSVFTRRSADPILKDLAAACNLA